MDLTKANWTSDGEHYTVAMPLTKVDKEKRLVSGWASLDNPDLQGDIVLAEASKAAFDRFRGNIREMHQPIAVGRMVEYRPDSYYDATTKKFYNGIFVVVYVSKGAESTWEKVLDGTLQAFSIHGPITEHEFEFSKDAGRALRIIKGYELDELSLVDSGGNQLANVVSISKLDGNVSVTGMIAETRSANVFYCEHESGAIAKTSSDDSAKCADGHDMKNIGWYEIDNSDDAAKVAKVISDYTNKQPHAASEGGVNVADEKEVQTPEPGSPVPAEVSATEQGKAETEVTSSVEEVTEAKEEEASKAADVSEVEDAPDISKVLGELKEALTKGLASNADSTKAAIVEVEKKFVEVKDELEKKIGELAGDYKNLTERFEGVQSGISEVEKRLGGIEGSTAVKKSGDLGGSNGSAGTTGVWAGSFL